MVSLPIQDLLYHLLLGQSSHAQDAQSWACGHEGGVLRNTTLNEIWSDNVFLSGGLFSPYKPVFYRLS